jgi:hypothetical protein
MLVCSSAVVVEGACVRNCRVLGIYTGSTLANQRVVNVEEGGVIW